MVIRIFLYSKLQRWIMYPPLRGLLYVQLVQLQGIVLNAIVRLKVCYVLALVRAR